MDEITEEYKCVNRINKESHKRSASLTLTIPKSQLQGRNASMPKSPAEQFLSSFRDDVNQIIDEINYIYEGNTFKSKYTIQEIIGIGSFSECRRVLNIQNGKILAAKIVDITDSNSQMQILNELSIWKILKHENILPLIDDFAIDFSYQVAISPLVTPGNMFTFLKNNMSDIGKNFFSKNMLNIFYQLCKAVDYLHNAVKIIHNDLKLENLLFNLDDNIIYLCDFGMSIATNDHINIEKYIVPKEAHGSYHYMAPEQLANPSIAIVSYKTDIWALGVILYVLMSGKMPFHDDYLPRLYYKICNGSYKKLDFIQETHVNDLITKLLTIDPKDRPNIKEILEHPCFFYIS